MKKKSLWECQKSIKKLQYPKKAVKNSTITPVRKAVTFHLQNPFPKSAQIGKIWTKYLIWSFSFGRKVEEWENVPAFQGFAWGIGFCLSLLGVLMGNWQMGNWTAGDCWDKGDVKGSWHYQRICIATDKHQWEQVSWKRCWKSSLTGNCRQNTREDLSIKVFRGSQKL